MYFQQLQRTAKRHRQEKDLAESVLKPGAILMQKNVDNSSVLVPVRVADRLALKRRWETQLLAWPALGSSATGMASAGKLSYSHGQR